MKIKRLLPSLALCLTLASCGATVINSPTTTTVVTTTTLPSGDVTELVSSITASASQIGALIVAADNAAARENLEAARAAWSLLKPQLSVIDVKDDGKTSESMQRVMDLLTTAVERKRPADADKAQKFSALILDSLPSLLQ